MKKQELAFLASSLALLAAAASAGARPVPVRAPVSRAFAAWTTNAPAAEAGYGYRPPSVDLSYLSAAYHAADARRGIRADDLPAAWDSREHGWITPVKDQGSYGTCWAHSTMACLETALLKSAGVTYDLSESHLAHHASAGYNLGYDDGGNDLLAAAMLTAWQDPLLESQDPYPNPYGVSLAPPMAHVQDIVFVPARTNSLDNAFLKRAIRTYGAVSVSYYHRDLYLNTETAAYRFSGSKSANHAVTAVGWDDDYPAANFLPSCQVPGNGAFLIKNSWGNDSYHTKNGYMWISYYDTSLATDGTSSAYPQPAATNNYGRVYSYDESGWVVSYGYKANVAFAANVFTATSDEPLAAVGFYAAVPETGYTVSVYTNGTASNPTSGVLAVTTGGTLATAGYHTLPFETPVPLAFGERFSVVLRLETPGTGYPVAADATAYDSNYNLVCSSVAMPGESFLSSDGTDWEDVSAWDINCCIKAYAAYTGAPTDPTEIYVAEGGDDGNDGLSPERPLRTIQAAIDRATSGDTICVAAGRYGPIVTHGKAVDIVSDDGAAVTFIDGGGTNRCADLRSTVVGQVAWLAGFTLENGCVEATDWSGNYVAEGAGVRDGYVYRCVIRNCRARGHYVLGGAVSSGLLWDCLVCGNSAVSTSRYVLGGACCQTELYNCTVADNAAQGATYVYGGAFYCDSEGWACNSIIVGTETAAGAAVYGENCLDEGEQLVKTLQGGDPKFVDRADGDYRLTADSPCVDAGYSDLVCEDIDLAGAARVQGRRIDQGCYESAYAASDVEVASVAGTRGGRHFGVFVGVNAYRSSRIHTLAGCVYDACAMRERCLRSGLWQTDDVTILTNACASEQAVRAAITNVAEVAEAGDTFVFYQSSHGGNETDDATSSYLCEHDCLAGLGGDDGSYYDTELASDLLKFADGVRVLVIVDACHSGGLFKSWDGIAPSGGVSLPGASLAGAVAQSRTASFDFGVRARSALTRQAAPLCSLAAAASASAGFYPGQVSASGSVGTNIAFVTAADYCQYSLDGSPGGAFTSALTGGWETGAADGVTDLPADGRLDFYELFAYASSIATGYWYYVAYRTEAQCDNADLLRGTLAAYLPGTWPETEINPSDPPEVQAEKIEESLLLAGFPADTAAAVTNADDYAALQSWSEETGVTLAEMAASPTALLSPAVGADGLIGDEAASNFLNAATTEFETNPEGGMTVGFTLSLAQFGVLSVNDSLLKAAIGVVGTADLGGEFTSDDLAVAIRREDEAVRVTVAPPAEAPTYFLRTKVR